MLYPLYELLDGIINFYRRIARKHPLLALCTSAITRRVALPSTTKGSTYWLFERSSNQSLGSWLPALVAAVMVWLVLPLLGASTYNEWADEQGYGPEYARFTA